ncbi:MAG: CotH kinase family protein [Muribaculaceae bacterium]|nr:CotH kinase family protein [Muribaculaceae bacterium]
MTANKSGILADDGQLYDWIEIKNISKKPANLKNYALTVEKDGNKNKNSGDDKKETNEDNEELKNDEKKTWEFPDTTVKPGECVIVFASKLDKVDSQKELHANFKLSSKGGKVQLLNREDVVSQVKYGPLEDDLCYRRVADNDTAFVCSYEQTPGFDNNSQGYEKYNNLIEQQRKGSLKIWKIHSKGFKEGNAWIEVKNVSDEPINLQDYCLTTSKKNTSCWTFPAMTLKPGETYVVDCLKARFKIGHDKAVIITKDEKFIDGLCDASAPFGVSMGRVEGKDGFFFFPHATKASENSTEYFRSIATKPTFKTKPGVYSDKDHMNVIIDTHGYIVHYTTDGSVPDSVSPVYKDSINIDKTTTIRAYCEGDSTHLQSTTATSTVIFAQQHTLPVMNITVKKDDLYNFNHGIYVEGPGASPVMPHQGANYWKKWWKKAHVEFYDSIGGFSEDCELAIFGGYSRALAKKSFKIRFKDYCGVANLDYDLFNEGKPTKYKNFVLRSGSQDYDGIMARDEFFTSLMAQNSPNLLVQAYRPIALYINGEYFGLYYIREKIDEHFAARHLNVSSSSVSMITGMNGRDITAYVLNHNLENDECYNYVKEHYDLEGLIDMKLGELYSSNTDIGNARYIYSSDENGDKKWHVAFYDIDNSWVINAQPSLYLAAGTDAGSEHELKRTRNNLIIQKLLKNKEFRQMFLERLSWHMHNTFTTQNTTAVFDNLINTIKPEMERNCQRWSKVLTYPKWEYHVKAFREKFATRNKIMLNDLRKALAITEEENNKYFADLGF